MTVRRLEEAIFKSLEYLINGGQSEEAYKSLREDFGFSDEEIASMHFGEWFEEYMKKPHTDPKKFRIINNAYRGLSEIETLEDLKRSGLKTSANLYAAHCLFRFVSAPGTSERCLSLEVAEYFRKNGYTVVPPHDDEVCFTISI